MKKPLDLKAMKLQKKKNKEKKKQEQQEKQKAKQKEIEWGEPTTIPVEDEPLEVRLADFD